MKKGNQFKNRNIKGFTLSELLIVVAIIAVLTLVSIPIFGYKLESSREETDLANVRSAKAAAVAQYMSGVDLEGNLLTSKGVTLFYDAMSGNLTMETPESYGRGTESPGGCSTHEMVVNPIAGHSQDYYSEESNVFGKKIQVFINDYGTIELKWV